MIESPRAGASAEHHRIKESPISPNVLTSGNRTIRDGPFCWQNKRARKLIRESLDGANCIASALSVYDALTEIASDNAKEQFTTTHAHISGRSGVSASTIKKHLSLFKQIGLLSIANPPLRGPATYRLLRIHDSQPLANDSQPLANDSQVIENGRVASLEEGIKKQKKAEESAATAAPASPSEMLDRLEKSPAFQGIDVRREYHKAAEWCRVNRKQLSERRLLNWLNRVERPLNQTNGAAFHRPPPAGIPEPHNWQAWARETYPNAGFFNPDHPAFAPTWPKLSPDHQKLIASEMAKAAIPTPA